MTEFAHVGLAVAERRRLRRPDIVELEVERVRVFRNPVVLRPEAPAR